MSESREELLRLARGAEDPAQADEERVLRALHSAIAAGASARVNVQLDARPSAHASLRTLLAAPSAKLGAWLAGLMTVGIVAVMALGRGPVPEAPHPVPAAPRQVSAPSTAADTPEVARAAFEAPDSTATAASRAATASRSARPAAQPARPSAHSTSGALQAELELLRRVQAALRQRDGARALQELDAQPRAPGALAAEQQAARILALCLLGRVDEARRAALAFASAHPDSPQKAAIAGSCANPQRIDPP